MTLERRVGFIGRASEAAAASRKLTAEAACNNVGVIYHCTTIGAEAVKVGVMILIELFPLYPSCLSFSYSLTFTLLSLIHTIKPSFHQNVHILRKSLVKVQHNTTIHYARFLSQVW